MEIILLEKIRNLGNIGEKAKVKRGFWRNYLLPKNKAILANQANLAKLEGMRAELEAKAQADLKAAQDRINKISTLALVIPAKASEDGKLFGSVNIREITLAANAAVVELHKSEISLPQGAIRQVGEYEVNINLYTDVSTTFKVKVVAADANGAE